MIVKTCIHPPGNFGDSAINAYLVKKITGKKPQLISISNRIDYMTNYIVSGSILANADENSIVWGAGFLSFGDKLRTRPKQISAVRGSLTRRMLLQQGIDCPEIYGDPTLLMPRFYKPKVEKTGKIGLIPHYAEILMMGGFSKWKYKKIDICSGVENVVSEVCSCKKILSSSLHGLIVAHAYGIPCERIRLSNLIKGDGFKFMDFESSLPHIDLDKLWEACPFK